MKKRLLALALVLILSVGSTSALAYAFPGSSPRRDDVRYFDMTAVEYIDRFNAKYSGIGMTLRTDPSHDDCYMVVNGEHTDIRVQFCDMINGPVTTGSGLKMEEWNWLYAYIATDDYSLDIDYFSSFPLLCSFFASVLGCEFTQEEFMANCEATDPEYPLMRYTKGGIENEIRFRDASVEGYHQTVYSVSIELLQDAEAPEVVEDVPIQEVSPISAPSAAESLLISEAQIYAEAERLLAAGDIAHAAMTFGRITDYRDAWERSSELWREIKGVPDHFLTPEPLRIVDIASGDNHSVVLYSDGTVRAVGQNTFGVGQCNVKEWHNIIQIDAADRQTVGLRSDGTVAAVGYNSHGECEVANWTGIQRIATGTYHTFGLHPDGTVVYAGRTSNGEGEVAAWTNIVEVDADGEAAIRADGTVVAAGFNAYGQKNVSDWKNIMAVSASWSHTTGLKADRTVVAVGNNYYGQCNVTGWHDIVQLVAVNDRTYGLRSDGTVVAAGDNGQGACEVSGWTEIRELIPVDGLGSYVIGLRKDGTVRYAGADSFGVCNVANWSDIVKIAAGNGHAIGLKKDGTVVAVGQNNMGQCDTDTLNAPVLAARRKALEAVSSESVAQPDLPYSTPSGDFNYAILQNEPGYIYDKFDDYWTWFEAYDEPYLDADLIIGIQLEGEKSGSNLAAASLYTKVMDKNGRITDCASSLVFLIDGVKYAYNKLPAEDSGMAGGTFLYQDGYELIKALAEAKEVSVKLTLFGGNTLRLDLDRTQFNSRLGNMCKKIVQYRLWDHYIDNPAVEMLEAMYPLEITKK